VIAVGPRQEIRQMVHCSSWRQAWTLLGLRPCAEPFSKPVKRLECRPFYADYSVENGAARCPLGPNLAAKECFDRTAGGAVSQCPGSSGYLAGKVAQEVELPLPTDNTSTKTVAIASNAVGQETTLVWSAWSLDACD
jgi:hypothetical protein